MFLDPLDIFEDFKRQRPLFVKDIDKWYVSEDDMIIVLYNNGEILRYDALLKTSKFLTHDSRVEQISEAHWRIEFSIKLQRRSLHLGLPQWELAQLTNISEHTISSYMTGQSTPSGYIISKLAKALECEASYLTTFERW